MTVETQVADLTTATTNLTSAVAIQQTGVDNSVIAFDAAVIAIDNALTNIDLVDNTSDLEKPISTATSTALNDKQETLVSGVNLSTINGVSLLTGTALVVNRGAVEKPVLIYDNITSLRTPSIIPLSGDVVNVPNLGEFQFSSAFEYIDDGETVWEAVDPSDGTTPVGQWVLTLPAYEWLEAQKMFENAVLWEWMEDEEMRFNSYQ
jgi:hypothetical protein